MKVELQNLSWSIDGRTIVDQVSGTFGDRRLTAIIGPNGSGKTTTLQLIAAMRKPTAGEVRVAGRPVQQIPIRERARMIALVEQQPTTDLDLTVAQVVDLGRIPHRAPWPGARDPDPSAAAAALELAQVTHLVHRRWQTLSGGERQRVQLARALAQQPRVLLLDEPTNHLDIAQQLSFLEVVAALPITTIAVLHDLDLAAAFCQDVLVLDDGKVAACGPINGLTASVVRAVFAVETTITDTDRRRVTWHRRVP